MKYKVIFERVETVRYELDVSAESQEVARKTVIGYEDHFGFEQTCHNFGGFQTDYYCDTGIKSVTEVKQ